jgi:hypothetical protein
VTVRGNVFDLCSGCRPGLSEPSSAAAAAAGAPNPPYPFFLGCLGSANPDLEPLELCVDLLERIEPAVAGR